MQFATVIGLVTASCRVEPLSGVRLCVLRDQATSRVLVAGDPGISPGVGDRVYFEEGGTAAMAWGEGYRPVDAVITGIVDDAGE